jgi:mRNA interferase MazF
MVNKWEIFFCDLNPTQGSEQQGTRPVLVISNDIVNHILPISTVLPLSSIKPGDKIYPTEIQLPAAMTGLPKDSVAMVQQIRTVAQQRLINKAGDLADNDLREAVKEALRQYFEI